jgi:membrane associated rhomboid family serine protease
MGNIGPVTWSIIIANVLLSINAFRNAVFFDNWNFHVYPILKNKDYKRLITSAFIHVDGSHLFFNMFSLYIFAGVSEYHFGLFGYLLLYFGSLLAGNVLALWLNRSNWDYRAVGASGAVSGVIFATILLNPGMKLSFIFFPFFDFPAWAFAIGFILYSLYGIRAKNDNIGHEAHLGGALGGMLLTLIMEPLAFTTNPYVVALMLLPVLIFLYLKWSGRDIQVSNFGQKTDGYQSIDDAYNTQKNEREKELNRLLDKIDYSGIDSLTDAEKKRLEELYGKD